MKQLIQEFHQEAAQSCFIPSRIQRQALNWNASVRVMEDQQKASSVLQDMLEGFKTYFKYDLRFLSKNVSKRTMTPEQFIFITKDLIRQFKDRRILKVDARPQGVWDIFLVPKEDSWRPVRNFSKAAPGFFSLNQGIPTEVVRVRFPLLTDVCRLAKKAGPDGFIFCLDGKHFYRQFAMHPSVWQQIGYFWLDTWFVDMRAPEGISNLPFLVQRATEAVIEINDKKACENAPHLQKCTMSYIDDFFGMCTSEFEAWDLLTRLAETCIDLGFLLNFKKVKLPSQQQKVLGFLFDLATQSVSIEETAKQKLSDALLSLMGNPVTTKKQLLSLVGKLCWFARVLFPARTFIRRLYDECSRIPESGTHPLSGAALADLKWWEEFIFQLNGVSFDHVLRVGSRHDLKVFSDASNWGVGAWSRRAWFSCGYHEFPGAFRFLTHRKIAIRELCAIALCVSTWGHFWSGKAVQFWCDNSEVVAVLGKTTSKDPDMMPLIRFIAMEAVKKRFRFRISWLSTKANQKADLLSRDKPFMFMAQCPKKLRRRRAVPVFGEFFEFE